MNVCFSTPFGKKTNPVCKSIMEQFLLEKKFKNLNLDFQENCIIISCDNCFTPEQDVALYLAVQEIIDSCVEEITVDIDVEKAKIEEAKAIIEEATLKIEEATRRSSIEETVSV